MAVVLDTSIVMALMRARDTHHSRVRDWVHTHDDAPRDLAAHVERHLRALDGAR